MRARTSRRVSPPPLASVESIVLAGVCAFAMSACAASAPALSANHPADPAAPAGRLAGPPAILRAARPPATPPADATPPDKAAPEHKHAH
ncbi:MAG TPA: hypothetical protein VM261_19245 [Kofleriaceae bacterium]|nr:hypothetical protein [Kofleriaceae bacterium]